MTTDEIIQLYDLHERIGAAYPRYRREESRHCVRMLSLDGGHDYVVHSTLSEENADEVIKNELAYFGGLGRNFEWKLYSHDRPADLGAKLASHGFSVGGDEAIMALELAELPAELLASAHHDIRRVVDEKGIADYAAVDAQAWPESDPSWMESIAATLRHDGEKMSAYVAYAEGIPVCAARIDFPLHSPFASLWGGATLEPYRKRGIYTSILAVRAREAIARGYKFLTIDASPMSRPIAAKHGFRLLAISNACDSPRK